MACFSCLAPKRAANSLQGQRAWGASPALAQGTRAGETQQGQAARVGGAVAGLDELTLAAWGQRLRSLNKMVGPRRESRTCFVHT